MTSTKMTFGKHKGKPVKDLPWQYLTWALKNVKFDKSQATLKAAMQQQLQKTNIFT